MKFFTELNDAQAEMISAGMDCRDYRFVGYVNPGQAKKLDEVCYGVFIEKDAKLVIKNSPPNDNWVKAYVQDR